MYYSGPSGTAAGRARRWYSGYEVAPHWFRVADLRTVWKSAHPLPIAELSDVEEILFHDGVGYVIEMKSTIHEVRRDAVRVVRQAGRRP